jgi:pimeloyl-ACP methyl ester carboxylesterase
MAGNMAIIVKILFLLFTLCITIVQSVEPDTTMVWKTCPLISKQTLNPADYKSSSHKRSNVQQQRNHLLYSGIEFVDTEYKSAADHTNSSIALISECAFVKVPFQWGNDTDSRSIEFFVKRIRVNRDESIIRKGQLWLLRGGPGGSGVGYDGNAEDWIRMVNYQYDLIIPDHRGTGRSELFGMDCFKAGIVDWAKCYPMMKSKYGKESFRGFGTTNAAKDVVHVARLLKQNDHETISVLSVSYGTTWLNRILTLYPNDVQLAIADSVVRTDIEFTDRDDHFLEAGNYLVATCQSDKFCASKFDGDVVSRVTDILKRQDNSTVACKPKHQSFSSTRTKRILGRLMLSTAYRKFIFPLLHRLWRCNEHDLKWLDNMGYKVIERLGISMNSFDAASEWNVTVLNNNEMLLYLVAGSEMSNYPLPHNKTYWINRFKNDYTKFFWIDFSSELIDYSDLMGSDRYYEPLRTVYAQNYTGRLLIMHGDLDPQTPQSGAIEWRNAFPSATFVWVKSSGHGTIQRTPGPDGKPVGAILALDWINSNGQGPVNTDVLKQWNDYNLNFRTADPSLQEYFTLHNDLFEGGPTKLYQPDTKPSDDKQHARRSALIAVIVIVAVISSIIIILAVALVITGIVIHRREKKRRHSSEYKQRFMSAQDIIENDNL